MAIISVIIPIYNTEKWLRECLDSLIKQSFDDFEVIMIDDGSKDGSGDICKEYEKKDKRFQYYFQKNAGVSVARNKGIEEAKGKYVTFVDSDDYILENCLEQMLRNIKGKDLSICECLKINDSQAVTSNEVKKTIMEMNAENYCNNMFSTGFLTYQGYIGGKLYKNQILKVNNIRFSEGIFYNEDRLFTVQYLTYCKKDIAYCDNKLYIYRINFGSATINAGQIYNCKMITELEAFNRMTQIISQKYVRAYMGCILDAFYVSQNMYKIADLEDKKQIRSYQANFLKKIMRHSEITLYKKLKLKIKYILKL